MGRPAIVPRNPGVLAPPRAAAMRAATPSSACSATARPKRPSQASGSGPSFSMAPLAVARTMVTAAGFGLRISTSKVSSPSSTSSSTAQTRYTLRVSPSSNETSLP